MNSKSMVLEMHLVVQRHLADIAFDRLTLLDIGKMFPLEVLAQITGNAEN